MITVVSDQVARALRDGAPVVALESTIITHGLPQPENAQAAREFEQTEERLERTAIPGNTPGERMLFVLGRMTRNMQRNPMLTEAITRVVASDLPSETVEVVRTALGSFAHSLQVTNPSPRPRPLGGTR